MFVLGHIGIGRAIIGSRGRALPWLALAIGTLLPDIIDKPLYYLHLSSFISCTRTFGHTGLFVLLLATIAVMTRSTTWAGLAIGAATHGVLDTVLDLFSSAQSSTLIALSWPFLHTHFSSYPFRTPFDQLWNLLKVPVVICELIGGLCLWWEYRARKITGSPWRK